MEDINIINVRKYIPKLPNGKEGTGYNSDSKQVIEPSYQDVQTVVDVDSSNFKYGLYTADVNNKDLVNPIFFFQDPLFPSFDIILDTTKSPLFITENGPNYKYSLSNFLSEYGRIYSLRTRIKLHQEFLRILYTLFNTEFNQIESNKSYYINSIEGLQFLTKKMVEFEKDKITITLNEDVSMISSYLANLYNNLSYSYRDQRQMIPANLLRFNMYIRISDIRNMSYYPKGVNENELSFDKSYIIYFLRDCTFNFYESRNFDDNITIAGFDSGKLDKPSSIKFDIYYKSIEIETEYPLIMNSFSTGPDAIKMNNKDKDVKGYDLNQVFTNLSSSPEKFTEELSKLSKLNNNKDIADSSGTTNGVLNSTYEDHKKFYNKVSSDPQSSDRKKDLDSDLNKYDEIVKYNKQAYQDAINEASQNGDFSYRGGIIAAQLKTGNVVHEKDREWIYEKHAKNLNEINSGSTSHDETLTNKIHEENIDILENLYYYNTNIKGNVMYNYDVYVRNYKYLHDLNLQFMAEIAAGRFLSLSFGLVDAYFKSLSKNAGPLYINNIPRPIGTLENDKLYENEDFKPEDPNTEIYSNEPFEPDVPPKEYVYTNQPFEPADPNTQLYSNEPFEPTDPNKQLYNNIPFTPTDPNIYLYNNASFISKDPNTQLYNNIPFIPTDPNTQLYNNAPFTPIDPNIHLYLNQPFAPVDPNTQLYNNIPFIPIAPNIQLYLNRPFVPDDPNTQLYNNIPFIPTDPNTQLYNNMPFIPIGPNVQLYMNQPFVPTDPNIQLYLNQPFIPIGPNTQLYSNLPFTPDAPNIQLYINQPFTPDDPNTQLYNNGDYINKIPNGYLYRNTNVVRTVDLGILYQSVNHSNIIPLTYLYTKVTKFNDLRNYYVYNNAINANKILNNLYVDQTLRNINPFNLIYSYDNKINIEKTLNNVILYNNNVNKNKNMIYHILYDSISPEKEMIEIKLYENIVSNKMLEKKYLYEKNDIKKDIALFLLYDKNIVNKKELKDEYIYTNFDTKRDILYLGNINNDVKEKDNIFLGYIYEASKIKKLIEPIYLFEPKERNEVFLGNLYDNMIEIDNNTLLEKKNTQLDITNQYWLAEYDRKYDVYNRNQFRINLENISKLESLKINQEVSRKDNFIGGSIEIDVENNKNVNLGNIYDDETTPQRKLLFNKVDRIDFEVPDRDSKMNEIRIEVDEIKNKQVLGVEDTIKDNTYKKKENLDNEYITSNEQNLKETHSFDEPLRIYNNDISEEKSLSPININESEIEVEINKNIFKDRLEDNKVYNNNVIKEDSMININLNEDYHKVNKEIDKIRIYEEENKMEEFMININVNSNDIILEKKTLEGQNVNEHDVERKKGYLPEINVNSNDDAKKGYLQEINVNSNDDAKKGYLPVINVNSNDDAKKGYLQEINVNSNDDAKKGYLQEMNVNSNDEIKKQEGLNGERLR